MWTNCSILTPTSFVFSSTSFSFCWAAQSGSWWVLVLSTVSYLQLDWLELTKPVCGPGLYNCLMLPVSVASAPNSTHPQSKLYPDIFDRIHLFLDWLLGRRSICYAHKCHYCSFRRIALALNNLKGWYAIKQRNQTDTNQMTHFLQDVFQMTAIVIVSVLIHYPINELYLYWEILYMMIEFPWYLRIYVI